MFRNENRSVFIVGAGASKEVDLPLSSELTAQISEQLTVDVDGAVKQYGNNTIFRAIYHKAYSSPNEGTYEEYLNAAEHIRFAMPLASSIDDFLEAHSDDKKIEACAKLAIVNSILHAEIESKLGIDYLESVENINKIWYSKFFRLLVQGCKKQDLKKRLLKICFIIFNYDRCVEHFLHSALMDYYSIDSNEAADILSSLEFIHPYGVVGGLPWQKEHKIKVDFGAVQSDGGKLWELSTQIKTFSEQLKDQKAMRDIINNIYQAGILVFLGFAFHPQNIKLLKSESLLTQLKIFATVYDRSNPDCEIIRNELVRQYSSALGEPVINLSKLTCSALFDEYQASLSLRVEA